MLDSPSAVRLLECSCPFQIILSQDDLLFRCHRNEDKTELEEKKKALKEATKDCATNGKKGNKKLGKRVGEDREREGKKAKGDNKKTGGLGKSLERAANKKKETPIGGKKLAAALDDMHT